MAAGSFHVKQAPVASEASAAPHCPAGHFSPYSDGEKDAVIGDFANHQSSRRRLSCALLPVHGEKMPAGRWGAALSAV